MHLLCLANETCYGGSRAEVGTFLPVDGVLWRMEWIRRSSTAGFIGALQSI